MDEQPAKLYKLIVKGAFDVLNQDDTDFTLTATYIIVDGYFNVGLADEVFTGKFTIELEGEPSTPDYRSTVSEAVDGPYVGSKALGRHICRHLLTDV